ncbi:aminotransferase class IV, partial [Vibrio vulnificus]|uniref:aminotransferase class IV n=1 Tax=Vibrio vulnificus TaxID=672 RepID=UPI0032EFBBE5
MNGTVYTAGTGVLAGTVREVILQVAAREGIPVVLEPPRLADLHRWEGCFISSTSRLLLPVDEASVLPEEAEGSAAQDGSGAGTDNAMQAGAGAGAGPT